MAKKKVSGLTSAGDITGSETVMVIQNNQSKKTTVGSLVRRRLLLKRIATVSHSGNTSETLMDSYTISAGTIQAGDILNVVVTFSKETSGGLMTQRLRVASSSGTSGTIWRIAQTNAASHWWSKSSGEIVFESITSQLMMLPQISTTHTDVGSAADPQSTSIDFSQDQTISVTVQLANAGDTAKLRSWYIELIR